MASLKTCVDSVAMFKNYVRNSNLVESYYAILNDVYVRKTVMIGVEVFDALNPFFEEPTVWNFAKSAFAVGKIAVEEAQLWPDDYFSSDEWAVLYNSDFTQIILKAISKFPYQSMRTSEEGRRIHIATIDGVRYGYIHSDHVNIIQHVFVETVHLAKAKQTIKKLLWAQFKDSNLVMRQNKNTSLVDDESRICFDIDDAFQSMPSERSITYSEYLQRCIDAGVSRSVMLYGPPGTGKSTLARTITTLLKMRCFRIRVEDICSLENATLFEAINIFEPDAIILDDFDRTSGQARLLESLEYFQRHVKLIIATVNDRDSLDEAILRPGRFDELLHIKQMDADVVRKVLGPDMQDAFETVKDWPVAFTIEYVKRRKFMSAEDAASSTEELAARVKRLEKYSDQDDVERMHQAILKKRGRPPVIVHEIDDIEPGSEEE